MGLWPELFTQDHVIPRKPTYFKKNTPYELSAIDQRPLLLHTSAMLRTGRFRHRLLDNEFLKTQSAEVYTCLRPFLELWRLGNITDPEIAAIYVLIFSFFRRPKDFLGGPHGQCKLDLHNDSGISSQEVVQILVNHLPQHLKNKKSLTRLNVPAPFLYHFCSFSLRSIPISTLNSLIAWNEKLYPLKLMTWVPTPDEVLLMQARGYRCVSMLIESSEMNHFVNEGRDVFGFIIHDLIHADHFFSEKEKAKAQIEFSKKILKVRNISKVGEMMAKDSSFESEFQYLMSDMNSVPLHLLKTLKAIFLGYFKRRASIPINGNLCIKDEIEFKSFFESILKPWNFNDVEIQAVHRLNTTDARGMDDATLLHRALMNFHDDPNET